jgi:hypothetical protein
MPIIANTTSGNTFSAIRAQLNSVTKRINQFAINESTLYANTINANTVLKISGTDVRATFAQNTYVKSVLANTNSRINLLNTNLTGTNTAIRALATTKLAVSNAVATYAPLANPTFTGTVTTANISTTGKVSVTQSTYVPSNASVLNAAIYTSGGYGGGITLNDTGIGSIWMQDSGTIMGLGIGTTSGVSGAIYLKSSGVGIGTTSPVNLLTLNGGNSDDTYGMLQALYSGTTTTVNAGFTAKNYQGTSQFMQWDVNGVRIGSRIITNTGVGNVYLTYGNDSVGLTLFASGYTQAVGSLRAPIFYDTDNTGYYCDPTSGSSLSTVTLYGGGGGTSLSLRNGGDLRIYNADNSGSAGIYCDDANFIYVDSVLRGNASLRAPIFYDSNDTGYYLDPNGSSQIQGHTRFGPYAGSSTTGNVTGVEIMNNGGTGDSNLAAISFHCSSSYGTHLHLRADGYFGAGGWSAGGWRWYVYMVSGDMTAAGNVTAYSDPRLKTNIINIESPLEKLKQLNGVRFKWIESSIIGHPGEYDYGILSSDVEKVMPELVIDSMHESPDGDKYKTVAYDKLSALLIEGMKEQQKQIEELREQIELLRGTK